ncbi:MAG: hypothetical protein AABX23_04620 [Nanoarchaeota archaeon]
MVNKRFIDLAQRLRGSQIPQVREVKDDRKPDTERFTASFLEGDFGGEVLAKYDELVQRKYGDNPILKKFTRHEGIVKGSNPYSFVAMNEVLSAYGARLAHPSEIDFIIQEGILPLRGQYEDMGLVLRSVGEPNAYLAQLLSQQLGERGITCSNENPIMIPLKSLELVTDTRAPQKLAFTIGDPSAVVIAPKLAHSNNGRKFFYSDNNGLPIFDENGDKTLYTENNGLRVLIRDWNLDLYARYRVLSDDNANGRVVSIRGEATERKNFGGAP